MSNIVIQLENIEKNFEDKKALDNINLTIYKNEILGIIGESGSGKTTLARILMKLEHPDKGQYLLNGMDITGLTTYEFLPFRKKIQMVFQNPYSSLNPGMTIRQILVESLNLIPQNGIAKGKEVDQLLNMVNFNKTKQNDYPKTLSGGERRRIGLARILALKPDILILDEPVAALDFSIKRQIIDLLLEIKQKSERQGRSLTYIWISHDLKTIWEVATRKVVMQAGKLTDFNSEDAYCRKLHYAFQRLGGNNTI